MKELKGLRNLFACHDLNMFILFFSIHLYFMFPYHDEGEMTTYRSSLVQNKTLAILAKVGLLDLAT